VTGPLRVREPAGVAGAIPAVRVEGLGDRVEAGLTTRARDFRFARLREDPAVQRAYAELDAFAVPFGGWVRVSQMHGARVLRADRPGADGVTVGDADGLLAGGDVSTVDGPRPDAAARLLTITVADCVPVFLAWPGGYGLLHAGWRGTAAGVLEAGLAAAGSAPGRIRLHLGPAIGGCCYEVGPEVVHAVYGPRGGASAGQREGALSRGRADRWQLDLRAALAARAVTAGVPAERISLSTLCTACRDGFHSFRASGERSVRSVMLAYIGVRAP
jgi:copper oxidase (laccase) domain-containing protein